jgi:hypothetical protein
MQCPIWVLQMQLLVPHLLQSIGVLVLALLDGRIILISWTQIVVTLLS